MRDWTKYDKGAIFRDKSKGGLLSQFLKEYKEQFGGSITPSCNKCLNGYYYNYLNSLTKMEEENKCNYELRLKYNGIKCKKTGRPVRNADMTDKQAKLLIKYHPAGGKLFSKIPVEVEEPKKIRKKRVKIQE